MLTLKTFSKAVSINSYSKNWLIAFMLFALLSKCTDRPSYHSGLEGKQMPDFKMLLVDSASISVKSISEGEPVVLFYFEPTCPYSRAQMADILDHMKDFEGVRFCIVSDFKLKEIKAFADKYQLHSHKNISIGLDASDSIAHYFNIQGVPFTGIYDKHKTLRQAFAGIVSSKEIKETISK